jgi:hypothetical protein
MNTFRISFLSEVLEGLKGKEIPRSRLVYLRARLRNRIYNLVVSEFQRQHGKKADLASRIGRDPAQITRWLSSPSNWTLDTISDLMAAMGTEPGLSIALLSEKYKGKDNSVAIRPSPGAMRIVHIGQFKNMSVEQASEQTAQTTPTSVTSYSPQPQQSSAEATQ